MPIRIAQVVEATTGGVARHVLDLVTRLDPEKYSCVLYLSFQRPDSWKERFRALRETGLIVREIPMARVPNPGAVAQLEGWVRRDGIDLLHLHSAKAGYLGRKVADLLGIPAIYTPHAFPFQRTNDWFRPLYRLLERRMAANTARILCVSEGEREEAYAAGLPEEKLVVIPNGIDLAKWPLPERHERREARRALGIAEQDVVIGAMARLASQKGIDVLLEASWDVLPDFPQARVMIWGDGPQRKALQKLAQRLKLPRVQFLGETRDPWAAYAAMDLYCAPSRWEGGPYSVLEAMACGVAVAASAVAGHTDYLVHEETGLLFDPELPGPASGALRTLIPDADQRYGYGQNGRKWVEQHFTVERMVAETAQVYEDVYAAL